ncbi:DUF2007 domain-containing protein [Bradyrhizobium sp.]|uniref:putative signal transducing protein n=1 Tax=Bradyrhizobium sp. TaxID=376 RepID=UPI0027359626|nr:DUF2007 domain-containing protein [Bradyrhizobium sp.]MDP3690603.1 DUF2007 domain-containing protein [Bradyrhizobium sp.]
MKTLYHASSAIEAHMLQDLLQQERIAAFVHGEHLQGAIGELPAAGLVRVEVNDADYEMARAVVARWEAQQPREAPAPAAAPASRLPAFLMGLAVGVALCLLLTGR